MNFIMCGAGFWAQFQLAGWLEVGGASCTAIVDPDEAKAETLAHQLQIPRTFTDLEEALSEANCDFVDIVTPVETHASLAHLAADHGKHAVCQKPMASTLKEAHQMVEYTSRKGTKLLINENWRWQAPLRAVKEVLDQDTIGPIHRARIDLISGFPVFRNQPFLKTLKQFILTDLGSHHLDVARFLFGEAQRLYCQTARVHDDINGEDVATVVMDMNGVTVNVNLAYAGNPLEHEAFPETHLFLEGQRGSLALTPGNVLKVTTNEGTWSRKIHSPHYRWAIPEYDLIHASIVPCQTNLLADLRGENPAETTAEDNLKTLELVFAAYESAETGESIKF